MNAARYRHDEESTVFNSTLLGPLKPVCEDGGRDWARLDREIVMAITGGNQWAALRLRQ